MTSVYAVCSFAGWFCSFFFHSLFFIYIFFLFFLLFGLLMIFTKSQQTKMNWKTWMNYHFSIHIYTRHMCPPISIFITISVASTVYFWCALLLLLLYSSFSLSVIHFFHPVFIWNGEKVDKHFYVCINTDFRWQKEAQKDKKLSICTKKIKKNIFIRFLHIRIMDM